MAYGCGPPRRVCIFVRILFMGMHVHAPWPCVPPLVCTPPMLYAPPFTLRAFIACEPPVATRAPILVHASIKYVPPFVVRALLCCVRPSHPCTPLPCAPLEFKFHEVVVHSTTWASEPSTSKRWLTIGCLGGDHSFYTHSHKNVHGCGCMHIKFHVINLFIVNAS
jgi:hypothetical protein